MQHSGPARSWLRWFVIAATFALLVAAVIAAGNGGVAALLTAGEEFPIREYLEAELGGVPLAGGVGHDGQQYFAIATDPLGSGAVPDLVDNPSYRYLFILYPALAGGLSFFPGVLTVHLMLALAVVGFGLAGAASMTLARQRGGRSDIAVTAVVNVGLLLAVRFLVPDALALGLALVGVTLAVAGRDRAAAALLAAAVLTKVTYAVFPLALGAWVWRSDRSRTWWLAGAPLVPMAVWAGFVFARFGPDTAGNLGLPFAGLIGAARLWDGLSGETVMAIAAAALLAFSAWLAVATGDRLLRLLLATWVAVALMSSDLVWEFGNNALRALAPLWALSAVAASVYFSSKRSRRNLPV